MADATEGLRFRLRVDEEALAQDLAHAGEAARRAFAQRLPAPGR